MNIQEAIEKQEALCQNISKQIKGKIERTMTAQELKEEARKQNDVLVEMYRAEMRGETTWSEEGGKAESDMYEGSEDLDSDLSLQAMIQENESGIEFEKYSQLRREGWFQIRDKENNNWLVPFDYHWNEVAKAKRIRI